MPTETPNLGLTKPDLAEVGWGDQVNANFDVIDAKVHTALTFPLGPSVLVPFSSTPTFDLSVSSAQRIVLTGNVTSLSTTGQRDGQLYAFLLIQDSVGGRPFTFPSSFKNAGSVSTTMQNAAANSIATQVFMYIAALNQFIAVTPLMYT